MLYDSGEEGLRKEESGLFPIKRILLLAALLAAAVICLVIRNISPDDDVDNSSSQVSGTVSTAVTSGAVSTSGAAPSVTTAAPQEAAQSEPGADVPYISKARLEIIRERSALLDKSCPDFIGWLYLADSEIDLPVVQGSDNDYYLSHAPDGSYNEEGTIFLDCMNSPDLSDSHNVLYGHNMVSGMFGDIRSFKERSEFDRHRFGWFITPEEIYRIDFFALAVASTYDVVYDMAATNREWLNCILENALFTADPVPAEDERLIALSTCASEYANARALFTGKLVLIEDQDEIIAAEE